MGDQERPPRLAQPGPFACFSELIPKFRVWQCRWIPSGGALFYILGSCVAEGALYNGIRGVSLVYCSSGFRGVIPSVAVPMRSIFCVPIPQMSFSSFKARMYIQCPMRDATGNEAG
jgi:hypothetical protein